jgi:thiosulfate dehydrogenase (quinone) large subunit
MPVFKTTVILTRMEVKTKRIMALVRVLFGVLLMSQAIPLMDRAFLNTLPGQLNTFCASNPFEPIRWLVYGVLIPNVEFVGAAFVIGQFLVGLSVALGFLTRSFALMGATYSVLFALLSQHMGWVYQHNAILLGLCFLAMAALDVGRFYGLDGYLFHREPALGYGPPARKATVKKRPLNPKSSSGKTAQKTQKSMLSAMKTQVKTKAKAMPPLLTDDDDDDEDDY